MRWIGQPSSKRHSPGRLLEHGTGRMPLADVHREARLGHDARVATLQPLVEPAHRLVAPFHLRLRIGARAG